MKGSFEKNDIKIKAALCKGIKEYAPMFHNHIELIYVIKGEIDACIDGKAEKISKGEVSIVFPYSIHSYEKSNDTEYIIVMFVPEEAELFNKELISYKPENPYLKNAEMLLPLFERLTMYSGSDEKMTNAYLGVVVGEVIRSLKLIRAESMDVTSAQQILLYCSEHFREDINLKTVSEALYLSESYVSKIFANKLGYSFREYINTLRISEAKRMLKNADMKITDVMYACGFKNQSSFNRIFFEETGITPSKYKEKRV